MKKILEVSSLCKQFSDIRAVQDVSFEAVAGEVVALLGPNGAGKSTLMNIIAGFIPATSGNVFINGYDVQKYPLQTKQLIGFLPEGAPMYSDMDVKHFLAYVAELRGLYGSQKTQRLEAVKEMAVIDSVWNMKIENLSKGYQRRVGFAQSLLADPMPYEYLYY